MNAGEIDNLHRAIEQKWSIGTLSTAAAQVVVKVSVTLGQDQKPVAITLLSFTGGTDADARQAFEAVKRTIYRAAAAGFNLPPDKYDDWKDLEMTFDPRSGSFQ